MAIFNNLLNDAANRVPITENPQTSSSVLHSNEPDLDAIWNMIDQRLDEVFKNEIHLLRYIDFQVRFPELSPINVLFLQSQNAKVTDVAEYEEWKSMGVGVLRGETSLRLLKKERKSKPDETPQWRTRPVFDIWQTTLCTEESPIIETAYELMNGYKTKERGMVEPTTSLDLFTWDYSNIMLALLTDNPANIEVVNDLSGCCSYNNGIIRVASDMAAAESIEVEFLSDMCRKTIEAYRDNGKAQKNEMVLSIATFMAMRGMRAVTPLEYLMPICEAKLYTLDAAEKRRILSQSCAAAFKVLEQVERNGWTTLRGMRYTYQNRDKVIQRTEHGRER